MEEISFTCSSPAFCVSVYDDIFTEYQCKEIIKYIDILEDRSLLTHDLSEKHGIDHVTMNMAHHYKLPMYSLGNFFQTIKGCVDHYLKEYSVLGQKKFLLYDVKVKKIPAGGGFHKWHFEDGDMTHSSRLFVVQVYLNDDFEGGETEFLYLYQRVQSKRGSVIIFPTAFTHTHRGNPPIGGTKYIVTSWGWVQDQE